MERWEEAFLTDAAKLEKLYRSCVREAANSYRLTSNEIVVLLFLGRHAPQQDLRILPEGTYLCADCTQQEREDALHALLAEAKGRGFPPPPFTVSIIVLAGVAQWGYRLELPLGAKPAS